MEEKESYSPEEVVEISKKISELRLSYYRLDMYHGDEGTQEILAKNLLKMVENYKKIPKNIRNKFNVNINDLEEIARDYL